MSNSDTWNFEPRSSIMYSSLAIAINCGLRYIIDVYIQRKVNWRIDLFSSAIQSCFNFMPRLRDQHLYYRCTKRSFNCRTKKNRVGQGNWHHSTTEMIILRCDHNQLDDVFRKARFRHIERNNLLPASIWRWQSNSPESISEFSRRH